MFQFVCVGAYVIDCNSKTLFLDGQRVPITKRQFETLQVLLAAEGRVVDREMFLETVWADTVVEDANLTQTIFMLRRILGTTPTGEEYIETVPRRGYRLSNAALAVIRPVSNDQTTANEGLQPTPRNETSGWRRFVWLSITFGQRLLDWSERHRSQNDKQRSLSENSLLLVSEKEKIGALSHPSTVSPSRASSTSIVRRAS